MYSIEALSIYWFLRFKKFLDSGIIYIGGWKSGQRSGYGICYWPDGAFYEGEWKNDKGHGYGRLIHSDGDLYEG